MEKVPSPVYYWAGMLSIVASMILWINGKKQESLFVGQWPPTFFILACSTSRSGPARRVERRAQRAHVGRSRSTSGCARAVSRAAGAGGARMS